VRALVLVPMVLVVATGCGPTRIPARAPQLPAPLIEPLPVVIALRYAPELYSLDPWPSEPDRGVFPGLGAATRATFDQVFAAAFQELNSSGDPDERERVEAPVDGVVELRLDWVSLDSEKVIFLGLVLDLRDATDQPVSTWQVFGRGRTPEQALRHASAQLLAKLRYDPEPLAWVGQITRPADAEPAGEGLLAEERP
jgi:hypothetical protein